MSKSAAERQRESRQRKRDIVTPENVTHVTKSERDIPSVTRTASLDDYNANPQDYATRAKSELLNWGKWMSADELAKARLSANRVAIPCDWDYVGVGKQVDGEWVVKPDPVDIKSMSDTDLQLSIKSYPGASWVLCPEYQEIQRRRQAIFPVPVPVLDARQAAGAAPVHEQARQGANQP